MWPFSNLVGSFAVRIWDLLNGIVMDSPSEGWPGTVVLVFTLASKQFVVAFGTSIMAFE